MELLLAAHLLLLRERRLLILLVLVRIARVGSLVGVALVRRLKWNLGHASLEAQIGEVGAASPGWDRQEREQYCDGDVAAADAVRRIWRVAPLVEDVAETDEVHERPKAGEAEVGEHVMLSRLGRRHLLEQILASDEAYRSDESHQTHPHCVRAHRVVAVDDTNVLVILVLDVAVGSDRAEHDERADLKKHNKQRLHNIQE